MEFAVLDNNKDSVFLQALNITNRFWSTPSVSGCTWNLVYIFRSNVKKKLLSYNYRRDTTLKW